jgi:hypothetical protein
VHGQPNSSPNTPNTFNRPLTQPAAPPNSNLSGAHSNEAVNPARTVPRPPQATGNGNTPMVHPNDNQGNSQRLNENPGRAPANTYQGGQNTGEKTIAPAHPANPPSATHESVPASVVAPPQPPARTVQPAPQPKNPPPPKENKDKNKDKEKEKDREPRGH